MPQRSLHQRTSPAALQQIESFHRDVVKHVQATVSAHPVVVVGMAQNPHVRNVRRALTAAGIAFEYLEYGSYFSKWKERLAIKMWSGWPTFPLVFVKGNLIGGAQDLERLIRSGELKRLLGE